MKDKKRRAFQAEKKLYENWKLFCVDEVRDVGS